MEKGSTVAKPAGLRACANPEYEVNSPEGNDSHETTTFGQDGV